MTQSQLPPRSLISIYQSSPNCSLKISPLIGWFGTQFFTHMILNGYYDSSWFNQCNLGFTYICIGSNVFIMLFLYNNALLPLNQRMELVNMNLLFYIFFKCIIKDIIIASSHTFKHHCKHPPQPPSDLLCGTSRTSTLYTVELPCADLAKYTSTYHQQYNRVAYIRKRLLPQKKAFSPKGSSYQLKLRVKGKNKRQCVHIGENCWISGFLLILYVYIVGIVQIHCG